MARTSSGLKQKDEVGERSPKRTSFELQSRSSTMQSVIAALESLPSVKDGTQHVIAVTSRFMSGG